MATPRPCLPLRGDVQVLDLHRALPVRVDLAMGLEAGPSGKPRVRRGFR